MSYAIIETLNSRNIFDGSPNEVRVHLVCDTAADLPAAAQTDFTIGIGSEALDISTGDKYVMQSSGIWVKQPSSAWENVYSKSETDALLQALADSMLTRADLYRGYQIAANTDLNDDALCGNYGTYYCSDGTTAATLSNSPITTSGFIMLNYSNGNRIRLFLAVSATIPRMYIQARTGGTWRTIRQFAMIDDIPAASDINLLDSTTLERITLRESAGGITDASTTRIGSQEYFEIPAGSHSFAFASYYRNGGLQAFVCYYDINRAYLGNTEWIGYVNWKDPNYAFPVPSGAHYLRVCFRYSNNDTIYTSDMIKCILSFS